MSDPGPKPGFFHWLSVSYMDFFYYLLKVNLVN